MGSITPPKPRGHMPSLVSVVVPCFNEEHTVPLLYGRLKPVLVDLDLPFEIFFVDDGSIDGTLTALLDIQHDDSSVQIIEFSRNFGHQIAVTAGIDAAEGDIVVLMDADLQDPPELLRQLIDKWLEGYDVIYAIRQERKGEGLFKRASAQAFYRFLSRLSEVAIPLDTGDFRLMDRIVVDHLRTMREGHRFVRGLTSWLGYSQTGVPYIRDPRAGGKTNYSLTKMLKFAMDGITSFSSRPLEWASQAGFIVGIIGLIGMLIVIGLKIFTNVTIQGWTSVMTVILLMGGIQLITVGIIGEYIGRIYDETRGRPLYIVRNVYGREKQGYIRKMKYTEMTGKE